MTILYQPKSNARSVGSELVITNEFHLIGTTGVATNSPNTIRLIEVPSMDSPSTVIIPGYTETLGVPGLTEFYVNYVNGRITFNMAQEGNTVFVTYRGKGSEVDAEDINEVQQALGGISNINGTLTAGIVRPNTISTSVADDFTFPHNLTVNNNLIVNGSTTITGGITDTGFLILGQALVTNPGSITLSQVNTLSGVVVTTSTNVTVTLPSPTVTTAGRFFTVVHTAGSTGVLISNNENVPVGTGITYLWDGTEWTTIGGTGAFPPYATDPAAPLAAQTWFNTTTNQFKGYNGSTVVILG